MHTVPTKSIRTSDSICFHDSFYFPVTPNIPGYSKFSRIRRKLETRQLKLHGAHRIKHQKYTIFYTIFDV